MLSPFQMHEREEMYSMWGPDIPHVAPATALRHFTIAVSGFVAFGLLCNYVLVPERPAIPRQFPYDGLVKELGGIEANKVSISSQLRSSLCFPYHRSNTHPYRPT
jgi:NADH dehydrogenase (ubiquinone) 1 beta subcomplex subunit 8